MKAVLAVSLLILAGCGGGSGTADSGSDVCSQPENFRGCCQNPQTLQLSAEPLVCSPPAGWTCPPNTTVIELGGSCSTATCPVGCYPGS
jgi:hypothetical protein